MRRMMFSTVVLLAALTPHNADAQMAGRYASVNGIRMYYETHGSGQPLVLIHGGGSTIMTTFGTIMPLLARTHRVIAVELQAHGHTSDRPAPESFEQDADDIAELLSQLKITDAAVLGFSNGGNTAMRLATRHPERVRRLVIASAFYKRDGMNPGFWDAMNAGTFADMPQVYKDEYLRINNDQAALRNMHDKDATRMRTFVNWRDEDVSAIGVPSLVVIGDHDIVRPEHAVAMYRLLRHGSLAILPGSHGSYIGEAMSAGRTSAVPEVFVAMVNEFLATPPVASSKQTSSAPDRSR